MAEENTVLQNSIAGLIFLQNEGYQDSWEKVLDAVNYPVAIVDGYWGDEEGNVFPADGLSFSGRSCQFRFIIADPYRTDDFQVIASVKDQYGTLNTKDVYEQLKSDLEQMEVNASPDLLYISPNGGQQRLFMKINNLSSWSGPDTLTMKIVLLTSVDGSSKHEIRAVPFNEETGSPMPVYGHSFGLSYKHTTTIKDRSIDMIPQITSLVGKWDDEIIPMMSLLCDEEFDKDSAMEYAGKLANDMGLAKKHRDQIQEIYQSNSLRTKEERNNAYKVLTAITQHIQEVGEEEPQWMNRTLDNAEKAMKKEINRIRKKKGK